MVRQTMGMKNNIINMTGYYAGMFQDRLIGPVVVKKKEPRKPPMQMKRWQDTMEPWEVEFLERIVEDDQIVRADGGNFLFIPSDTRAARMWKSSQMRRFRKYREKECGIPIEWVVTKWSWRKFRFDKYLVGYNLYPD